MAAPPREDGCMKRILAATDGSEGATRAVEVAARLAKDCGATLAVVTVGSGRLTEEEARTARTLGIAPGDLLERFAREILDTAVARAREIGVTRVEICDCVGDAAQAIAELAERDKADMVVVGRRGRGRLAGLVLGSVSQKLATSAPCAVVTVP